MIKTLVIILFIYQPVFALKRGIGYGVSDISHQDQDLFEDREVMKMYLDEVDYSDSSIAVHHDISFKSILNSRANINNNLNTKTTLQSFEGTLGLRLLDQKGFFQPWIGSGISFGAINLKTPRNLGGENDGSPFTGEEVKFISGWYAEAGMDIVIKDSIGLRFGVKHFDLQSDKFKTLDDRLNLEYTMPYMALVMTARGCNPWWFLYLLDIGPKGKC